MGLDNGFASGNKENALSDPSPGVEKTRENGATEYPSFREAESRIQSLKKKLNETNPTSDVTLNEGLLRKRKENLITEVQQFVSSSKLFVKSATECQQDAQQNLFLSVALLERISDASKKLPENHLVINRLIDVSDCLQQTIGAAIRAKASVNSLTKDPLMKEAAALAAAVASLLTSLGASPS